MSVYREKHLKLLYPLCPVAGCSLSVPGSWLPCQCPPPALQPCNSPRPGLSTTNFRNVLETLRTVFQCVIYSSAIWNLTWCFRPPHRLLYQPQSWTPEQWFVPSPSGYTACVTLELFLYTALTSLNELWFPSSVICNISIALAVTYLTDSLFQHRINQREILIFKTIEFITALSVYTNLKPALLVFIILPLF